MSVFKLPKTWCKKINAIIVRFLWGASNGDRKIHWRSWEDMTKSKDRGGLGFRELNSFNTEFVREDGKPDQRGTESTMGPVFEGYVFSKLKFSGCRERI